MDFNPISNIFDLSEFIGFLRFRTLFFKMKLLLVKILKLNIMKKLILLILIIGICISSCSKDSDDVHVDVDKIIGTWGNYKDVDLGDGYIWDYDPNDIENQIIFNSDGTVLSYLGESTYIEGTWENMKNGNYKFAYLGIVEITEIDFVGNDEMVFRYTDEEYYWIRIN